MACGARRDDHDPVHTTTPRERIIRPAAVVPERVARLMLTWLQEHDVTNGGLWAHDVSYIKRFSGPFDGPSGMRGSAVLLGSIYLSWDRYEATIYRAVVTDDGARSGLTVDRLCDDVLVPVGLTLATCPRAVLLEAAPDPFWKASVPRPRPGSR
jgi:hypothetical protein